MATREVKVCDVYGVTYGVKTYAVTLCEQGGESADNFTAENIIEHETVDLCPRAVKRLKLFIGRGCSPPPNRNRKSSESADVPGQEVMGCANCADGGEVQEVQEVG